MSRSYPKCNVGGDALVSRTTHIQRLVHAFKLDVTSLTDQFDSLQHVARNRMTHVGCSTFDAWAYAVNRVKQHKSSLDRSTWELEQVMHRYGTMSGNTSMVEQKFSVNAKIMNKQRLACSEATEERIMCMPMIGVCVGEVRGGEMVWAGLGGCSWVR